jgi:hypothetical protein
MLKKNNNICKNWTCEMRKMQFIFSVPLNEELEGTLHPQKFGCTLKNENKNKSKYVYNLHQSVALAMVNNNLENLSEKSCGAINTSCPQVRKMFLAFMYNNQHIKLSVYLTWDMQF